MKFYTRQHNYYCGIDLHTKNMYVCILNQQGEVVLHRNVTTQPDIFLQIIQPYKEDVIVGVECIFTWYWLADLCEQENLDFVLGHALYMKAIHGGKAKNDKIDSRKIAVLLRGGMFPVAYAYPAKLRPMRDLLRRRNHFMRKRAELFGHIQNTASQYNLGESLGRIQRKSNREGLLDRFSQPAVQESIRVNIALIETYDRVIAEMEYKIGKNAKEYDPVSYTLLRSVPGIGRILGLVILYEIGELERFVRVQDFVSYSRLVKSARESNGKIYGSSGKKIGNAHLKWAFSEAALLFLRCNPKGQKYMKKLERKHSKGKALSILAHKLGRTVYFMLKNKEPFKPEKFYTN